MNGNELITFGQNSIPSGDLECTGLLAGTPLASVLPRSITTNISMSFGSLLTAASLVSGKAPTSVSLEVAIVVAEDWLYKLVNWITLSYINSIIIVVDT